jgi:glycosyltransferase involved in cell wall biosynthesis
MNGNTGNPLVSVIINCYNGEAFLKEAIDSVFKQTYFNWEIIFWDNCSTDNSAEIAKKFGEKVKYYLSEYNTKLGEARNQALKKCKGEYIAFLDVDDIWYFNKLEIQIKSMLNEKTSISYTACDIGTSQKNKFLSRPKYKSGDIFGKLIEQFEIILPTAIIKKDILDELVINFNTQIVASEEYDLFVQIAANKPVTVINDSLCFYRISPKSLTNQSINFRAQDRIITLSTLKKRYTNAVSKNIHHFNKAKYKIWYYKFQAALYHKKINIAKLNINKIKFKDFRYFLIFTMVYISPILYKKILKIYDKRGM